MDENVIDLHAQYLQDHLLGYAKAMGLDGKDLQEVLTTLLVTLSVRNGVDPATFIHKITEDLAKAQGIWAQYKATIKKKGAT